MKFSSYLKSSLHTTSQALSGSSHKECKGRRAAVCWLSMAVGLDSQFKLTDGLRHADHLFPTTWSPLKSFS
jgi:hypothetical protein